MEGIGGRLKAARRELGLTQQVMAVRLGVKKNTISCYESGARPISAQVAHAISLEFGIEERWLLDGQGNMLVAKPDPDVDSLVSSGRLRQKDIAFVRALIELSPAERDALLKFMQAVAEQSTQDATRENKLHAELDRQLEAEKSAQGKSSACGPEEQNMA